jgi:simple sugar transport system ATP-binding protein
VSGAPATAPDTVPRLELRGIVKRYGEVITRDAVSRGVMPRQIHAVRGENGAARSTRVKIVYGARCGRRRRDPVDGRPAVIRSPAEARAPGIGRVWQHLDRFDALPASPGGTCRKAQSTGSRSRPTCRRRSARRSRP